MKGAAFLRRGLIALACASALTLAAGLGALERLDGEASDAFYQSPGASDGTVVVIGMDQRATDYLGPMPWSRNVLAEAIEFLNYGDPEGRPAAIGLDVLFVGDSADPSADAYLAEMAGAWDNVIVAEAALFGSELVDSGDSFYMDTRAILGVDKPYDALKAAARVGHINAMADTDSILRHGLLYIDTDEGRVWSFSRVLYERWCEVNGLTPNPLPETRDRGFWYVPFTTRGGGYYEDISLVDLLNGDIEPSYFNNKIVLIGPYASGMQDEYRTSVDHSAPMYGVEFQANMIDAYRNGFYPREVSERLQLALLFLISAALIWLLHDRRVLPSLGLWLAAAGGWLAACFLFSRQGLLLHVLWVPLAATAAFIGSVAVNYIRAAREKHRVTNTFGHYVDPAVMRQLLDQGPEALELGGKVYNIAVLFVDIRGFTTMSEALDAPTVVEIINRYLTLTTECIMRHHGTLDKFVGDCTMAFWNAPVAQEDPVYLACCAAMDMLEGSKALGQELQERFGRTVSFGVGVNVGDAVVGNIGAPRRMDYTAIGDTVNTAARLEANAPGGTIYISRAVADALGDRAKTTSLGGSIPLKGKAAGFEVLKLDALEY